MSHSGTDDRDTDIVISCRSRPTVAGDIGSEFTFCRQHLRKPAQQWSELVINAGKYPHLSLPFEPEILVYKQFARPL